MVTEVTARHHAGMVDTTTRRLSRSTSDRHVAGVAGGIGAYLGIDPVLIRIGFVVLTLAGGSGILVYIVAWVLLPEDDEPDAADTTRHPLDPRVFAGVVLVVLGVLALGGGRWWFGDLGLPLLLLGGGAWLLLRPGDDPLPWFASPPTPPPGPTIVAEDGSASDPVEASGGADTEPTRSTTTTVGAPGWPPVPPLPPVSTYWSDRGRRRHRPSGPPTGRIAIGLLVILAGLAGLTDGAGLSGRTWLLAASAVATLGLLIGAFTGRARQLIGINTLLVLALVVDANGSFPVHRGVGERLHRPEAFTQLEPVYEHGVGHVVVDLRGLDDSDFPAVTELAIDLGVGEVDLWVPDDVRVIVEATALAGNVRVFDQEQDGTDVAVKDERSAPEGAPRLEVTIELGIGEVDVR